MFLVGPKTYVLPLGDPYAQILRIIQTQGESYILGPQYRTKQNTLPASSAI